MANKPARPPRRFDEHVNTLNEAIGGMSSAAALIQNNPLAKATQDLRAERDNLRKQQLVLREIAYGLNYEKPGIIELFRVDGGKARVEMQIASAARMLNMSKEHKTAFIDNGSTADFIEQLEKAINAVQAARSVANNLLHIRREAFQAIEDYYEKGRKSMAFLSGVFHSALATDKQKLGAWEEAQQVEYRRNPKRKQTETNNATANSTTEVKQAA